RCEIHGRAFLALFRPWTAGNLAAKLDALLAPQHRPARFGEAKAAVGVVVRARVAEGDELAEDAAPRGLVEVGADAEDREVVVLPLLHPVGGAAEKHVDEVHGAEALAGAVD